MADDLAGRRVVAPISCRDLEIDETTRCYPETMAGGRPRSVPRAFVGHYCRRHVLKLKGELLGSLLQWLFGRDRCSFVQRPNRFLSTGKIKTLCRTDTPPPTSARTDLRDARAFLRVFFLFFHSVVAVHVHYMSGYNNIIVPYCSIHVHSIHDNRHNSCPRRVRRSVSQHRKLPNV